MKLVINVQRICTYMPITWLTLFIIFVLCSYFKLGHLPHYNVPDPKLLGFDIFYGFLFFTMPIILFSALVWIVLTLIILIRDKKNIQQIELVVFLISYLLFYLLPIIDPLGLDSWFMD